MAAAEVLDHEEIVERAEAVRFWLLGFSLSGRASGPLQRELGTIIADEAHGMHPLAGLTVADFIAELHTPSGGAVGRVKGCGEAALNELRAAIRAQARARKAPPAWERAAEARPRYAQAASAEPLANGAAPAVSSPVPQPAAALAVAVASPPPEAPQAVAEAPEAPQAVAQPAPRRRGRPKGSTKAAKYGAGAYQEAPAPAAVPVEPAAATRGLAQSGQPERLATPGSVSQAAPKVAQADPDLVELARKWPALHPHARRAVMIFASSLLAEAAFVEGQGAALPRRRER